MAQALRDEHICVPEDVLRDHMMAELSRIEREESIGRKKPPTIYRVPGRLREVCPDAYEPKLVSIGPLHRRRPELQQMEQLKWKYLHDLIRRRLVIKKKLEEECQGATLMGEFIRAMWRQEEDVRERYSEDVGMEASELVEVLVLDGCFLIELFIKRASGPTSSPWRDALWNMPALRNDLLMLENQIPFSVLITLFSIAFPEGFPLPPFGMEQNPPPPLGILDLALHYINKGEKAEARRRDLGKQPHDEIHHLLHLSHICQLLHFNTGPRQDPSSIALLSRVCKKAIRGSLVNCFFFFVSLLLMCKCPRLRSSFERDEAPLAIPSARNLKEAGIKFKEKRDKCFLNISFDEESGRLEVPMLCLTQCSNAFFRNLIAFEQCCLKYHEARFTVYATFMDSIIDTTEDVDILVKRGIIAHKLGSSKDVVNLFNNLCKGASIYIWDDHLDDIYKRVNKYCDSDRHRWRAALVNSYFHSPWSAASLIAAVVLLLLTFVATIASIWQTIYTVKSYEEQFP